MTPRRPIARGDLYQLINAAFALRSLQATTVPFGGFANTGVGSVVLWRRPKTLQLFGNLANDKPVPGVCGGALLTRAAGRAPHCRWPCEGRAALRARI